MMNLFAPLMLLVITILIVSVTYIIVSTRHKEKMMIMKKNLDPNQFNSNYLLDNLKWGMLLLGFGFGFLSAFIVDTILFDRVNGTEALYPSLTALGGGLSLILFYSIFKKKK